MDFIFFLIFKQSAMLKEIDFFLFASPRKIRFAAPAYGCSNSLVLHISNPTAN